MINKLLQKIPGGEQFWEVMRFLVVGGGCYLTSSAIAFTVSLLVNYFLCVTFVFHARNQSRKEMILFAATSFAGLGINQITMWFFVEIAGLWYMFAKVIASAVVMIWNYFTKRYILKK